jgi:hypothetical protein
MHENPQVQKVIDDLVATCTADVVEALNAMPKCEICYGPIPGGRPRDPDAMCPACAEAELEMAAPVEIDGFVTRDDVQPIKGSEVAGSVSRIKK